MVIIRQLEVFAFSIFKQFVFLKAEAGVAGEICYWRCCTVVLPVYIRALRLVTCFFFLFSFFAILTIIIYNQIDYTYIQHRHFYLSFALGVLWYIPPSLVSI